MSDLKRNIGQKVALVSAVICALLVLPTSGLFVWLWMDRGGSDSWVPSVLTSVFFLAACAVVLYVMSRPKPPLPVEDAQSET